MKKIGFIGLGKMGSPMARNLYQAGHEVMVYNRTPERALSLQEQGIQVAQSIEEVVKGKDVVITMLSNDEALKEILIADDGVLDFIEEPTLLVDMSTVSPETSIMIAEMAKEMGITMLDAPVSGSVNAAEGGNLLVLVGGESQAYENLKDIFSVLGKESYYFGLNGAGSRAKLVINLMLGMTMQGICESLILAEKFGLDRPQIIDMMQQSALASPFLGFKRHSLITENFPAAFALKHMHKDFGLILEEARKNGAVLPATSAAYQTHKSAINHDMGNQDMAVIFAELLQQSGKS